MAKRKTSKKFSGIKKMPPLYHKLPGQEYSYDKSEVLNWVKNDLELQDWFFRLMENRGIIIYDSKTGKWQGKDYRL
ncbi:hypothetical protein ACLM47_03920 [Lactococcus lactis]|uniref:hypothetical protein n=1 Tax=Lactococcus lactis TaxID=1358 RepID=UPI00398E8EC6